MVQDVGCLNHGGLCVHISLKIGAGHGVPEFPPTLYTATPGLTP